MKLKKFVIIILTAILIFPTFGCGKVEDNLITFTDYFRSSDINSVTWAPSLPYPYKLTTKEQVDGFVSFFKKITFNRYNKYQKDGTLDKNFEQALNEHYLLNVIAILFNDKLIFIGEGNKLYAFNTELDANGKYVDEYWYVSTQSIEIKPLREYVIHSITGPSFEDELENFKKDKTVNVLQEGRIYSHFADYVNYANLLSSKYFSCTLPISRNHWDNHYYFKCLQRAEDNQIVIIEEGAVYCPDIESMPSLSESENINPIPPLSGQNEPNLHYSLISYGSLNACIPRLEAFFFQDENSEYKNGINVYDKDKLIARFYYRTERGYLDEKYFKHLLSNNYQYLGDADNSQSTIEIDYSLKDKIISYVEKHTFDWTVDFYDFLEKKERSLNSAHLLFDYGVNLNEQNDCKIYYYILEEEKDIKEVVSVKGIYKNLYPVNGNSISNPFYIEVEFEFFSFGLVDKYAPLTYEYRCAKDTLNYAIEIYQNENLVGVLYYEFNNIYIYNLKQFHSILQEHLQIIGGTN